MQLYVCSSPRIVQSQQSTDFFSAMRILRMAMCLLILRLEDQVGQAHAEKIMCASSALSNSEGLTLELRSYRRAIKPSTGETNCFVGVPKDVFLGFRSSSATKHRPEFSWRRRYRRDQFFPSQSEIILPTSYVQEALSWRARGQRRTMSERGWSCVISSGLSQR